MKGYFITGTDTGVGKTFVTALIAGALREKGVDAGVMKPVETGCKIDEGVLLPEDAVRLKEASGSVDPLDLINPYRFRLPLSPFTASLKEGGPIETGRIRDAFLALSERHDVMLVEGAGGILVPVTKDRTMADIAVDLGLPIILVAASRTGVLSHTLLTLHLASCRGMEVRCVALNNTAQQTDESADTNLADIRSLTGLPVVEVPYAPGALVAGKPAPALKGAKKEAASVPGGGLSEATASILDALGL